VIAQFTLEEIDIVFLVRLHISSRMRLTQHFFRAIASHFFQGWEKVSLPNAITQFTLEGIKVFLVQLHNLH